MTSLVVICTRRKNMNMSASVVLQSNNERGEVGCREGKSSETHTV